MDLGSIFANFGDNPWENYYNVLTQGAGLLGGLSSMRNNNVANGQVQGAISSNTSALQQQAAALQDQINQQRQQAQDMYQRSLGDVTNQNQQLQSQIDTGTSNLAALSDPNSAYMQQARQAIERKDAAAGRRSQWGDRETQLAGMLAENVSKYSPAMQSAITQARNQIASNNSSLADLYNRANNPAATSQQQQLDAIRAQIQNATAANGIGRQSANQSTTAALNTLAQGGKLLGGIAGLFNGGGGGSYDPLSTYYSNLASQNNGITGYGNGVGSLYGLGGSGSLYDNGQTYGYGTLPAGDYFGGGGLGGVPTGDYSIWD